MSAGSIALRRLFPWSLTAQKILHSIRPYPFRGDHVFVGSDYGGNHKTSRFRTYAYLTFENQPSRWTEKMHSIRAAFLPDGRRMSFKRLGDPLRQEALVPFLQAADTLPGQIVTFAVEKGVNLVAGLGRDMPLLSQAFQLRARWSAAAIEDALLKALLFSIVATHWSRPMSDVTWITDEDDSVANEARLDDVHQIAARLSSSLSAHPHRIFAMNTPAIFPEDRYFEDLLGIADLAAGATAELCTTLAPASSLTGQDQMIIDFTPLKQKSDLLVDWLWFQEAKLKRVCIVASKLGTQMRVFRLDQAAQRSHEAGG